MHTRSLIDLPFINRFEFQTLYHERLISGFFLSIDKHFVTDKNILILNRSQKTFQRKQLHNNVSSSCSVAYNFTRGNASSHFNETDGTKLFLPVRDVCRSFRAAVDTHHRYALDCAPLSKTDFRELVCVIRPEFAIALTLSDRERTPGQIGVFLSRVDIGLFTRLRSLTLLDINKNDLCHFLEHAKRLSLTSLTLQLKSRFYLEEPQFLQHLSSIIDQRTLVRLELLDVNPSRLINQFRQPMKYKFLHLRLACDQKHPFDMIIDRSPNLKAFVLDDKSDRPIHFLYRTEQWFSASGLRLTSLTLLKFSLRMIQVQSLLSRMPSLRHIKIVTSSADMTSGSRWEELIKSKLPTLNKFEFYTRFLCYRSKEEMEKSAPNEMIAPFCTPFWTEEKQWWVICNIFPATEEAEIYTPPICISHYTHVLDPETMTMCNFVREDQQATVLELVNELGMNLSTILVDDRVS